MAKTSTPKTPSTPRPRRAASPRAAAHSTDAPEAEGAAPQVAASAPVRTSPAPKAKTLMVCRRPMSYAGRALDREQVFALAQQPHDERLVRLGYVAAFAGTPVTCGTCGSQFASTKGLEGHGAKRHAVARDTRPQMLAQQPGESDFDFDMRRQQFEQAVMAQLDGEEASEEARLNREAPLNWERTVASMAGV